MLATATLKERSEADKTDILSGKRIIDEVRQDHGWNAHADEAGAKPLLPLNATTNPATLAESGNETTRDPPNVEPPGDGGDRMLLLIRDNMRKDLVRMANRLGFAAAKGAKPNRNFLEVVEGLEGQHRAVVTDDLRASVSLLCEVTRQQPAEQLAEVVDAMFGHARRVFLSASECQVEQLPERVESAAAELRTLVESLADELCTRN